MKDQMSVFAETITRQKYSHDGTESWTDIANRVGKTVLKSVGAKKSLIDQVVQYIDDRKFIPGGRYLYATGRHFHQVNNCLLLRAEDSREGWAELMHKCAMGLMTGAGIGVDYSSVRAEGKAIRKTGGTSTGPLALAQAVNELGRSVMQGGSRRSALWSGLKWSHPDSMKFINMKNWIPEVRAMKAKDFNFPATMDGTNISVQLDDEFFEAYTDEKNAMHSQAYSIYWAVVERMLKTAEPGFSIDLGKNSKETLRNACQPAWATVLTPHGVKQFKDIEEGSTIWSGKQWTKVTRKIHTGVKEVLSYGTTAGVFYGTADHRIVEAGDKIEAQLAEAVDTSQGPHQSWSINDQDVMDGLVIGDGTKHKASNNLMLLVIGSKDGDYHRSEIAPLIGRYRPGISELNWEIQTTIEPDELPKTYERWVPERFFDFLKMAGFLRGLFSANGSIAGNRVTLKASSFKIITDVQQMLSALGIRSYYTINKGKVIKFSNGEYPCKQSYDLNISGDRGKFRDSIGFLQKYKMDALDKIIAEAPAPKNPKITFEITDVTSVGEHDVFDITVAADEHTYWTGGLLVSNCTELVSADDSDVCNLGSINLARIESLEEMQSVVETAIAFLLSGTVYSDVPYAKVDQVRSRNRRLGLGLMGVHEWLLIHGHKYGACSELDKYLDIYATSGKYAAQYANEWDLSKPIKTRAIAPTGTIGIIGETTTGLEPVFCAAFKRRYAKGSVWHHQYVLDPTAKRLIEQKGVDPEQIEDAYVLAENVERRIAFQAHVQKYVDHAISSTINLPEWGSELNNQDTVQAFGTTLMKYLPQLRGITVYPDGSRSGQPLTPVKWSTAVKHVGETYTEQQDICEISGKGGSCGS